MPKLVHPERSRKMTRLRRMNRKLRERMRIYRRWFIAVGIGWTATMVLLVTFAFDEPDPVLLGQGRAGVMTPDTVSAEAMPEEAIGPGEEGEASYYSESLSGNPTASGEPYNPGAMTAAHRTLPIGSRVRVTNLRNNRSIIVRINDRGPFTRRRVIDLSRTAAQQLGMLRSGTAPVRLELLPSDATEVSA